MLNWFLRLEFEGPGHGLDLTILRHIHLRSLVYVPERAMVRVEHVGDWLDHAKDDHDCLQAHPGEGRLESDENAEFENLFDEEADEKGQELHLDRA